jgi:hypothetical protein
MNKWIQHVKQVQAKRGCSYKDALKLAKQSYKTGGKLVWRLKPDGSGTEQVEVPDDEEVPKKKAAPFKPPRFIEGVFDEPAEEPPVRRHDLGRQRIPYTQLGGQEDEDPPGEQEYFRPMNLDVYIQQRSPVMEFVVKNLGFLPKEDRYHAKDLATKYDHDNKNLTAKEKHRLTYYLNYLESLYDKKPTTLKFTGRGRGKGR